MTVRLVPGDCLEEIPRLVAEGVIVDAIVTDPPYDLISVSRKGSLRSNDPNTPFGRTRLNGKGFMSMSWDGTGIAFRPETWATVATIMRPGAFLLAFGGTRTFHRMACAIEDAGFVIQDTILDVVASDTRINAFMDSLSDEQRGAFAQAISEIPMLSWKYGSGFPKGRTQLKPSFEPICVAYKPGGKRELQIDECRIPTGDALGGGAERRVAIEGKHEGWARPWMHDGDAVAAHATRVRENVVRAETLGRWPANVCHSGDDEVMEAFAAFGESKSSGGKGEASRRTALNGTVYGGGWSGDGDWQNAGGLGDTGSVARYFYCAKADTQDRWGSKHPTVKPVELISWLVKLVTPPQGTVLDPFAGSGTMAVAAMATGRNAILIERDETYCADIRERIAHYEGEGRHSIMARNRNRQNTSTDLPLFGEQGVSQGKIRGGYVLR